MVVEELNSAVLDILKGELQPEMVEVLLVLIFKNENPTNIKQFCPISLCNVSFTLITKVLVNRLKTIMKEVTSPNQSNFIPYRQVTNNMIIC